MQCQCGVFLRDSACHHAHVCSWDGAATSSSGGEATDDMSDDADVFPIVCACGSRFLTPNDWVAHTCDGAGEAEATSALQWKDDIDEDEDLDQEGNQEGDFCVTLDAGMVRAVATRSSTEVALRQGDVADTRARPEGPGAREPPTAATLDYTSVQLLHANCVKKLFTLKPLSPRFWELHRAMRGST